MRGRADDAGPDLSGPSKLVESVMVLLEDAGVPPAVNDQVVQLIEGWECGQAETPPD